MNLKLLVLTGWLGIALYPAGAQAVLTANDTQGLTHAPIPGQSTLQLKSALEELERHFDVHFIYEGTVVANRTVSLIIRNRETLESILKRILGRELRYRKIDGKIYAILPAPEKTTPKQTVQPKAEGIDQGIDRKSVV